MARANVVNVALLSLDGPTGRWALRAEPVVAEDRAGVAESRGFLRRFETRYRAFRDGLLQSKGHAAGVARRAWGWLQSRTHPDEPLLARLHSAQSVEVLYPSDLAEEEAARLWAGLLAEGRRRHRVGLIGHALVAPLSVALAPLPGPNVLGYWFVYRAVRHGLILAGLRRIRRGALKAVFRRDHVGSNHRARVEETVGSAADFS